MDAFDVTLPAILPPPQATDPLRVVAQTSLFRSPTHRHYEVVPHGATLLELVLETGMGELRDGVVHLPGKVVVLIDGNLIEREYWHLVRPRPGRLVNIFIQPESGRTAMYVGIALAIGVAAIATGGVIAAFGIPALGIAAGGLGASILGGIATSAIMMGGMYALTAFLPMEADNEGTSAPNPSRAVTGQSNRLEQNAFVPVVRGSIRLFPVCYAKFYTEKAGSDTYLRALYCVGQGPLAIDQLKSDESDLEDLGIDAEVEIREGRLGEDELTLFTEDRVITEINPSATIGEITRGDGTNPISHIQTTAEDTITVTVDIKFPGGIVSNRETGKRDPYSVEYDLAIRVAGTTTWFDFENGSTTLQKHQREAETSNLIYVTHRRSGLSPNTYDVRLRRRTGDNKPQDTNVGNFFWTALRAFRRADPRPDPTIACIAVRVKRAQTTTLPQISCRVRSYAPDWNGTSWVEALTRNPASLALQLLRDPQYNPNPVDDDRIDWQSWQEFHEHCEAESFAFDEVFDDESTVRERVSIILASGRGRLIPPDTLFAVAIDRNGKAMSGMITPRNSFNFRGAHVLRPALHALRVRFKDRDKDFAVSERVVYNDGFNASNANDGNIEVYDLTRAGIADPGRAWRHGRYRIADYMLRQGTYSVHQGLENLQAVPGDLVGFQHDVPLLGLGPARVKTVSLNGSNQVTSLVIDDAVTMEAGKTYMLRTRSIVADTDVFTDRPVTTVVGVTKSLSFSTPFPANGGPFVGDLVAFGQTGLATINCIVKDILPGPNNTAEVILVDEAPGVNEADHEEIPPYDSQITLPGDFFGIPPNIPIIDEIRVENIGLPSQPDVITTQRLVIHLEARGGQRQPPVGYEVEIKRADQVSYQRRYSFPADTLELTIDVVQSGVLYDVRVRAIGRSPQGRRTESDWSAVRSHFVPRPRKTVGTSARVTGLELSGQGNTTTFLGNSAHAVWRITGTIGGAELDTEQNQLVGYTDPRFSYYEVEMVDPTDGYVRSVHRTTAPEFTYTFDENKKDSLRRAAAVGSETTRPLRRFTFVVKLVDTFGNFGPAQTLTVRNPAPADPSGLLVSGKQASLLVKANIPTDGDFEKMKVYIGTASGFNPGASSTQVEEVAGNVITITDGLPGATGTTLFVRVAMADAFSDQHTDLNLSDEIQVTIESPTGPPVFEPVGIEFTARRNSNVVRWDSGSMIILHGGSSTQESISAGQATWTSGILWIYYVMGTNVLQATTSGGLATGDDRTVVAHYRGGNRLSRAGGSFPVTNSTSDRGSQIEAPRNTWVTVITPEAITTAGNPVTIIFACDVSGANADTDDPGGGELEALVRVRRNNTVIRTWSLQRQASGEGGAPLSVNFGVRTVVWIDEPGAGTYDYDVQIQIQADHVHDFDAIVRCTAISIYETML